jgi:pantoate--beta-alanine ligase
MNILHSLQQLETWLQKNPKPAFVPTMGALHEGHLSLVREAKKSNTPVLTSIFVNPKQFGPNEDFQKYPRDRNGDMKKLASADADAIWFPTEEEVYPTEPSVGMNQISIIPTLPSIFSELEGAVRPSHFLGVAQVLQGFLKSSSRLLRILVKRIISRRFW